MNEKVMSSQHTEDRKYSVMHQRTTKTLGMVLVGGGARGAYQVGVVRYLAEAGIQPKIYAGASIGALNAAIIALSANIQEGYRALQQIWVGLSNEEILTLNNRLLFWGFLFVLMQVAGKSHPIINTLKNLILKTTHVKSSSIFELIDEGLFDNGPLHKILNESLCFDRLQEGYPLWISVCKSEGSAIDIARYLFAELGLVDYTEPEFLLLQDLPKEDQLKMLLASAALPIAFQSQSKGGIKFNDGGLGGLSGNVPVAPLIDAGCECCIVVHLSDGSLWDRSKYPDGNIIEVRPESSLHPSGVLRSLLDFSPERINELMELGFSDASRCIGNAINSLGIVRLSTIEKAKMLKSCDKLQHDDFSSVIDLL